MITDCICSGLSPNAAAMLGRAVLSMVPSSVCMKKPTAVSRGSHLRWAGVTRCECSGMGSNLSLLS
ncbi:hypothetical protein D3C81_1909690 [compost metagenome]